MPHHLTHLDEAEDDYDHIYLAPHLDDAALSCGGAIARHTAAGQRVLVVTFATGTPPADVPLSSFATEMHTRWKLSPDEAVRARLLEDLAANATLSADNYWLGLSDAIYRRPDAYESEHTLFGPVAPDDPLHIEARAALQTLAARFPGAMYYAPLGVGHHVDHQIIYSAAAELLGQHGAVAFYEDFPYVTEQGALEQRLDELGGRNAFLPSVIAIDTTLARKISAIEVYRSQIATLFGGAAQMAQTVTSYAEGLRPEIGTYGERLWLKC